jgi:glycosyltransferase involved in cell wall biosynthesis
MSVSLASKAGGAVDPARQTTSGATRPLRICRVVARLNVGGVAVHIAQLTAGLDSERFTQLVVTGVEGRGEASMLPMVRARGVEPVVIPELGRDLSVRNDFVSLVKLYRLFRRWRPDVVETHTAKAGTLGRVAALLAGVPVRVHVFHGHIFQGFFGPRQTRLFVAIERLLARASTRIVALSDEQRDELLAYGVGRPDQMAVVPLGLDLGPYLEAPRAVGDLRAELGLAETPASVAPIVGIVGRLVPTKAHEVFLAGAERILATLPEARFVVVGDGERRPALETLAARPPLAGRVHFLGWRSSDALRAIYADLDLLTLTSDAEGTPVVVIEGMTAGCPVVATDVGGVRSMVRDGETGHLVPPRDPDAWARACLSLLGDPARRQAMGTAARAAVYPKYDVSTLLRTMTDFYLGLPVRVSTRGGGTATDYGGGIATR